MDLLDIKLSAQESNWRLYMVRKADPAFLAFQEKVFTRDEHTCQFCGFQADTCLDVVNRDGNYQNNRTSNLLTACPFCSQCFFLEAIGKGDFGGGALVYLPEMTQGELNAFCHVLFASMLMGTNTAEQSKNIYRSIRLRTQPVEKHFGEGFSNPALLGHMLIDAHHEQLDALHNEIAPNIRVLPTMIRFAKQLQAWAFSGMQALRF